MSSLDARERRWRGKIGKRIRPDKRPGNTRYSPQIGKSVLVEKLVVEDGSRQHVRVLDIVKRVLGANQSSLAEYAAVLLARDFFRHLKDQFHQRIRRQLLRAMEHYARLADVLDQAFIPGMEIFSTIPNRKVRPQAPCPGHPRRLLLTGAAPDGRGLRRWCVNPTSTTHGLPVVLVSGGAHQADLVVLPIGRSARPGKLVRTASQHKNIHESLRHDVESCPLPIGHLHLPTASPFWVGYFRASRLRPYAFPYGTDQTVAHGLPPRRRQEFPHGHEYRQSFSGLSRPNLARPCAHRDGRGLRPGDHRRRSGQVFKIRIYAIWTRRVRHFRRMRSPRRDSRGADTFKRRTKLNARCGHALRHQRTS